MNRVRILSGLLRLSPRSLPGGAIGTFMARDALALAPVVLGLSPDDVVLLPAFHCREVLRPFAASTTVRFYDVRDDLSIDPEHLEAAIVASGARLVLVINYFGFVQPDLQRIADACEARGAWLLEDCAHSFLSQGSGSAGHLSVASYRKLLPVFDGGSLTLRGSPVVPPRFAPRLYANVLSVLATVKALSGFRSQMLSRAGVADHAQTPSARPPTRPAPALPMSWFARNGIANAPVADIIDRKRRDYLAWHSLLAGRSDIRPVQGDLPPGVCPLVYTIRSADRDAWRASLLSLGVRATVQWAVPAGLAPECSTSHRLAQEVLSLPVYPELSAVAFERVRRAVAEGAFA